MQPEHSPLPGNVSLPAQPLEVCLTNLRRACSLSGIPMNCNASVTLKPNTSPHLHLLFTDALGRENVLALNLKQ